MQPSDGFLEQWEQIIEGVSKTDIPLECIKKIVVKPKGGKQFTINIHNLLKQGMELEEVETVVMRQLEPLHPEDDKVDFVVDIKSVAKLIQPETDKLLGKI